MTARCVVTGASGFIGRRLCAALHTDAYVVAIAGRGLDPAKRNGPWNEIAACDLSRNNAGDPAPARWFEGAEVVFHLAGRAHAVAERKSDIAAYTRVNVDGTRRVVEWARAAGVRRFVFASSVKAMGEGDGDGALSPYGQSKRDAEEIVLQGGLPEPVVLRLSLVYGPGVEGNLGGMLRAVRSYRFPPPPPVPNRRAMVHVDDVVRALIAAAESPRAVGRTIVIGDGVEYSTRELYDAMNAALGRPSPSWSLPGPCWRALALAGDAIGAITRRRAPFDSDAYRKLFGSAWYEPGDMGSVLGVVPRLTIADALPAMVAQT